MTHKMQKQASDFTLDFSGVDFDQVLSFDDAIEVFCLIILDAIEKKKLNRRVAFNGFKEELFEGLNQVAQNAPLDLLLGVEADLFNQIPDNPQVVSDVVKNKINEVFDSLLSLKKAEAPPAVATDSTAPPLTKPQALRSEILSKIPEVAIEAAGIKLSLHTLIETVLSDRVMDRFYNNVFVPAKQQAEKTTKSRVIPLAIGLFLIGGLTGATITYFITRKKNKKG